MNTKVEETTKSEVALREESVLEFWREHDVFKQSLETPGGGKPKGDFVFYDGPPFATGLPHYGHILAGTIKDAVPRFWTMNGYRVRRKWGWDCHGLPLENLIEKKLGLATKRDIEEYGVKNFNEAARSAVLEYADDWKRIIPRMGRFVDMDDDYKTMDSTYTESVWWVFKSLHEKGLVYEGFKSMHLCPRCGTTLSNFEVNLGYKDIKDISVYVKLPLIDEPDTSLLVWTTTPWTLPGNMAAAVHEEATYVAVRVDGASELLILAKENAEKVLTGHEVEVVKEMKGADLVGKSYTPPFDTWQKQEFENKANAWKIYHAPYVEIGADGTGAVHLAPAYGEEDMELAKTHAIPIVHHVDTAGHFMDFVSDFNCQLVKPKDDESAGISHLDADIEVVRKLNENERLFKKENITHSYPHCWRCDTPLLNYATTSWFVEVTKVRDDLVAENQKVHWVPEHVGKNRFGKWLEGARDWAVSRQRYWGAPLPIWRNPETNECKVFGSLRELQEFVPNNGNQFFITRHAESVFNTKRTLNVDDQVENGLTETGKKQAAALAGELKQQNIDLIYYSPLQRTKETAELLAAELGLTADACVADVRLLEVAFGEFEGKTIDEYHAFLGDGEGRLSKRPEGGETWTDMKQRLGAMLYEIDALHKGKRVLFVSHNGPLQMLQAVAKGDDRETTARHIEDNSYDVMNAELRELPFAPLPHNDNYELDFHRPYIDDCELFEDGVQLKRIPDVFDCWFESGSMPYAETHYPFENLEVANPEKGIRFPADFISEAVDQTRGWFYSLMVLGVSLFGKSPFNNVITNGLVLAEDGKKMSKSLQNYPDPMYIADTVGVDSMRFYLLSSPIIKGEDLNFSEKGVLELQRKNIGRLHNVLLMYEQYADGTGASDTSGHILDRWILSRLAQLTTESTEGFRTYELDRATRPVTDFIDDLSVWYLRRSRDRIKSDNAEDKAATLATLRFVLQQLSLIMAPAMPFYAEYLWGKVKGEGSQLSVHLCAWPEAGAIDETLLSEMAKTRDIVSLALEQRAKAGIKVRQPLSAVLLKEADRLVADEFLPLILDEVNVKTLQHDARITNDVEIDTNLTDELRAEGDIRELMRQVQDLRKTSGLNPGDAITLIIQTSDGGEALISQFEAEFTKTVGATSLSFGNANGSEITVGSHSFTVEVTKV